MEAYRSADEVAKLRAAELEAELARLQAENVRLVRRISRAHAEANGLAARLAEAGPAGGAAGPARDRVGLLAMLLAIAGFPLLSLHAAWHAHLDDATVVPPMLLLGVPGLLAAWVARPHARVSGACRFAAWLGLAFAAFAVGHALFGGSW
ncbi:MAG TPA: hypothetical protein VGM56_00220 [Byssovorax sp.]